MSDRLTSTELEAIRLALMIDNGQFVYRSSARALLAEVDALVSDLETAKHIHDEVERENDRLADALVAAVERANTAEQALTRIARAHAPAEHLQSIARDALASSVQNPSVCSRCAGTDPDCYICAQFAPAVQEPQR